MPVVNDLEVALTAARSAAGIIRRWFRRIEHADFKGRVDPVTAADREAEAVIVSVLAEHRPDDGLLGEEGSTAGTSSGRRWVFDPLDGTVNFVHGIPHVAVSIGLEDEQGGLAGVVLDVFRDEEFTAERGAGAFLGGEPIAVSGRDDLHRCTIATGFPYDREHHGPSYVQTVGAMLIAARDIRRLGTAALDLAWVACGRVDGYWEYRLHPWDVAAGAVLVTEAGGALTDTGGGPFRYDDVLASNGRIHGQLSSVVAANRPAHLDPL
jgi:myo-inositol-1(or 4)-monophosphatase